MLFDGVPAPLAVVSGLVIEAVAALEIAGKNTVGVTVQYGGMISNTEILGVLPAVPGILGVYAGALDAPAAPGSIVSLAVIGSGVTIPPQTDGQIGGPPSVPALPVSVWLGAPPTFGPPIAWIPLTVTYAGSASWLPAGSIQVNVQLPDPLPATNDGDTSSPCM